MMLPDYALLHIDMPAPAVMRITMARAEKKNALNPALVDELTNAFHFANEAADVRVVILAAQGDVFSAGADLAYLRQLQSNTYDENLEDSARLGRLFSLIYSHKKLIIAAVQGHAIAGGCGLACVCDLIYAVPEARFGYSEVKIGFIPAIVMVFLLRKIGEGRARELLLTGKLISAETALAYGMITEVARLEELESKVLQAATTAAESTSAQSIARTRAMIAAVGSMEFNEAIKYATEQNAEARATEDCHRGISAFLNRERISWLPQS